MSALGCTLPYLKFFSQANYPVWRPMCCRSHMVLYKDNMSMSALDCTLPYLKFFLILESFCLTYGICIPALMLWISCSYIKYYKYENLLGA